MMKFSRIMSSVAAAAMLCSVQSIVYTVEAKTIDSANALISDAVEIALHDVQSSTKDTALVTLMSNVTTSDAAVLYKGATIGYWYSTEPTTLYADASKTTVVITQSGDGYEFQPALLYTLLSDVNENLIENYVAATDDWGKIIGKYDVTLGDVIIPAGQWLTLTATDEPLIDHTAFNVSRKENIRSNALSGLGGGKDIIYFAWLVDSNGNLYIQNQLVDIYKEQSYQGNSQCLARYYSDTINYKAQGYVGAGTHLSNWSGLATSLENDSFFSIGVMKVSDSTLFAKMYMHDTAVNANATYTVMVNHDETAATLHRIDDCTVVYTDTIDNAKAYGVAYAFTETCGLQGKDAKGMHDAHMYMYETQSSSRKVTGNSLLRRRLSAVQSLLSTDTVVTTPTQWTVNGLVDINNYIGSQQIIYPGSSADIPAIAETEALQFNVVVPTSLPVYVDATGITYVADSAKITNKSGAAIKLVSVDIVHNASSGWTQSNTPSKVAGAQEYKFDTTIEENKTLAAGEVYPFDYSATLSPTVTAESNLELATVKVTVDWDT